MPHFSKMPDMALPNQPFHTLILDKLSNFGNKVALGDVVSLLLPNCMEYPLIYFGAWLRGAVCSAFNPVCTEYELENYLKDCTPKFICTSADLAPKVLNTNRRLRKKVQTVLVIRDSTQTSVPSGTTDFDTFMNCKSDPTIPEVKFVPKDDVAWLPYSSGTTGPPKGVMTTHFQLSTILTLFTNKKYLLVPEEDNYILAFLPMYHIFGFALAMLGLFVGGHTLVIPRFEPHNFLKTIQDYKVRLLYAVPPILVFLAKDPTVDQYDIRCLTAVATGAAPLGRELSEELMNRHPNIQYLVQLYGMTEDGCTHVMPPTPRDQLRHGSCGIIISNFQCKVVDITSGQEVGVNERGEVCIKGPGVMKGYLNRPEATAQTFDAEGWLHTGDIGYYDNDGYYYIVDRLKELIKVKGYQVPPAELEDLLLSLNGVQDAAVIGIPDVASGELPRAYVVLKDTAKLTVTDIQAFVAEKVAHYKHLKGGVEFVKQLPKSPSGKILRRTLRDAYLAQAKLTKSKV